MRHLTERARDEVNMLEVDTGDMARRLANKITVMFFKSSFTNKFLLAILKNSRLELSFFRILGLKLLSLQDLLRVHTIFCGGPTCKYKK